MDRIAYQTVSNSLTTSLEAKALQDLEESKTNFKKVICVHCGIQNISIDSYQDAFSFMYRMENQLEDPENVLGEAFELYHCAYHRYKTFFPNETATSTRDKLDKLQWKPKSIMQKLQGLFISWFYKDQITKYQGRMSILSPEGQHHQEVQKVLTLFPSFFSVDTPVQNLTELKHYLELCRMNPVLNKRREWFESHIALHINSDLDSLLERNGEHWSLKLEEKITKASLEMQKLQFKIAVCEQLNHQDPQPMEELIEVFVSSYRVLLNSREYIFEDGKKKRLTPQLIETLCSKQQSLYQGLFQDIIRDSPQDIEAMQKQLETVSKQKTAFTERLALATV